MILQVYLFDRFSLAQVETGVASISLSATSSNYFDEYLDEIIYFFERTGRSVVIFEDLDRFHNPHIFETLRELNGILNASKQLRKKHQVRFIYAIKDSIFSTASGSTDAANGTLSQDVVNRTKFFDVIIPIVPFITYRSAASHITSTLADRHSAVSPALIEIVATHVTDMRLIKNINNELMVFEPKILGGRGIQGLDLDRLFAMMVYKNTHLADYEKLRIAASSIDLIYKASREIVRQSIERNDGLVSQLRAQLETQVTQQSRLSRIQSELTTMIRERLDQFDFVPASYRMNGEVIDETKFGTPQFWQEWVDHEWDLEVVYRRYNTPTVAAFTYSDVNRQIDGGIDLPRWVTSSREDIERQIRAAQFARTVFAELSMSDLFEQPLTFTVSYGPEALQAPGITEGDYTLEKYARALLATDLAFDLLRLGYIDQNYLLYGSEFLDTRLSATAMNYLIQHVQRKSPDFTFVFDPTDDLQELLEKAGALAFSDRSLYNLSLVDHMLDTSDPRIAGILESLGEDSPIDEAFVGAYLAGGGHRADFVRSLAHTFPRVFDLLQSLTMAQDLKLELFSAALEGASPSVTYVSSESTREALRSSVSDLQVLTNSSLTSVAASVCAVLAQMNVEIPDVRALSDIYYSPVVDHAAWELNFDNIAFLSGADNGALDEILRQSRQVADRVLEDLPRYLTTVSESAGSMVTVHSSSDVIRIANLVQERWPDKLERTLSLAEESVRIDDLTDLEPGAIPAAVRSGRVAANVVNLVLLVEAGAFASVPELLEDAAEVALFGQVSDDRKLDAARSVIASDSLDDDQQIKAVRGLCAGLALDVSEIRVTEGDLWPMMLREGIISDEPESLNSYHPAASAARLAFLLTSTRIVDFIEEVELSDDDHLAIAHTAMVETDAGSPGPALRIAKAILSSGSALESVHADAGKMLIQLALRRGWYLQSPSLRLMMGFGMTDDEIVRLLSIRLEVRRPDNVRSVLLLGGGPLVALTKPGHSPVLVPAREHFRQLVDWLRQNGKVSSVSPVRKHGLLKVNMRRA